jgi:dolichyl-phosphate beta-glucosyltransferase
MSGRPTKPRTTLVIPCFNEARRLDPGAFGELFSEDDISLLFVDDGSTDTTRAILQEMADAQPERISVLALAENSGKAEAVRRGLIAAIESKRAELVGYLDADLATPVHEIRRLIGIMCRGDAQVVLGARVALLGRQIERSTIRHYLGRVFATLASMTLRLTIYDTQCGAKLFRVTLGLAEALRERFISRWAFDVELLGRLLSGSNVVARISTDGIWEEPLLAWRDVKGSKLDAAQMGKVLLDLARIELDLARRRARAAGATRQGMPEGAATGREVDSDIERTRARR